MLWYSTFETIKHLVWCIQLKFKIRVRSDKWLLIYSKFYILRSSSVEGHLHLKPLCTLVWSPELKFKIWLRSHQWLLLYSSFYIFRSSSLENEQTSGFWDIPLFIFWGHLPLEVIFLWNLSTLWFGPFRTSLKFEWDQMSVCWYIPLFIFWGRLPLKLIFIWYLLTL